MTPIAEAAHGGEYPYPTATIVGDAKVVVIVDAPPEGRIIFGKGIDIDVRTGEVIEWCTPLPPEYGGSFT